MDDALLKLLQEWTCRVPLLVVGSGASVPLDLPSMSRLGTHLMSTLTFSESRDQKQFDKFKVTLSKNGDLEATLSIFPLRPNVLHAIIVETWKYVNKFDLKAYEMILSGKMEFPLSRLVAHLVSTAKSELSIITTNYDRLIEYAASYSNSYVNTGFTQNYIGSFSDTTQNRILTGYNGQVNVWKVHGSLDWFKDSQDQNVHLPLRTSIPDNFVPSIVTPGIEKYQSTHNDPFRTVFTNADKAITKANGFMCIGYGFNDQHVQPYLIRQIKLGKPIIVIAKELTKNTKSAIIGNNCKNYVLMEEANSDDTRVLSSLFPDEVILSKSNFWSLDGFLKLIL